MYCHCFRCLGEGYPHVAAIVPFSEWYAGELSQLLTQRLPAFVGSAGQEQPGTMHAVLQVRLRTLYTMH
jgi:hypothetical protein